MAVRVATVTGETITVIRAGAPTGDKDRYGHPVLGADVETDYPRCLVAPAGSSEPVAVGRRQVVTLDTVYRRADVDVTAADRVRVRGVVRDVEGVPAKWTRGGRTFVVIRLKDVDG